MRYRILIVEDEPISLEMLSKTLKEDYNVLTADNGKKGFELYKKFNPHIIISDLNMPIMNGIELIQKIRELDQNSKIIITTFKDDVQTLLQATELKLFKYLIKPIDFTALKNIIEESIEELNRFNTVELNIINISPTLIWKTSEFELFSNNQIVKLTPKEKKVLNLFLQKPNQVFTYNEIIYEVWEKNNEAGDRKTLKTMITGLRKKIKDVEINNVYGYGYKIVLH
mgnify:FL=1